ncbi:ABC transporter substrate-binding protein [Vallitalea guaymasensis]|nr:MqnA/MqnD/SBP family protein [Vallitalea guaymasensis]
MKNLNKILCLMLTLVLMTALFAGCKSNKKKDVEDDVYTQEQENNKEADEDNESVDNKENTDKDAEDETNKEEDKDEANKEENKDESSDETILKDTTIRVATLKGPTGMGMAKLMEDVTTGESEVNCDFTLTGAPDDLVGKIVNKEVDFACLPTNLASVLYNKTEGGIKLAAVNTLGVLYIMEVGNEINDINDLKGKEIYASGKGSVPDYILQYILKENSIDPEKDVDINFSMQHAEVATTVISGDNKIALLPQPFVTTVSMKNKDARIALDITKEWEKIQGEDSPLAMGCIVVDAEFAANNKELVDKFLQEYKESVDFVNANHEEAGKLIEKHEILPSAAIAQKAIPNCNIVYMSATDAKDTLQNLYEILFDFNPKSLGGKLPDGDFYYQK